jgi:hypothetical protein
VLDPKVHDEEHQQGGARDALQVPVEGSSRHASIQKLSHAKALRRKGQDTKTK